ncbi:MAG: AAA family ATPase [Lachnospiraceae bacterium]|nr:AAA family ATPase [Lachnospiraceae bacterium]
MARTVGIGIQDFGKIIRNNCFYVDKTALIKEWWENQDDVTLITRPRRFGKTLAMSMLEHFFSVEHADKGALFEGLDIWKEEKYRSLQGSYPVIFLSFADVKETSFGNARDKICRIIKSLYDRYSALQDKEPNPKKLPDIFDEISPTMGDSVASYSLKALSEFLADYYGKKVIILLDEYDTPMQEAYVYGYWEEMAAFIRNLFNSTFKTNPYMERAVMTGITRISKESIFSDLNHLEVVTSTSCKYEASFGFTEMEVFAAMDEFGLTEKEEVRAWYDGFTFGNTHDIYNPWSIINYLDKRRFAAYWANTSSNSLVGKLIQEGGAEIKIVMEDLLQGKSFHASFDEQIVFSQLDHNLHAIWSLLLACGYLKVETYTVDGNYGECDYTLSLTNKEVRLMFRHMIDGWFADYTPAYNAFIKALLLEDKKAMNVYMNQTALATFSSFDIGNKPSETAEPERFYHGFVLGLIVDLADRYRITSNRESGFGRYDVMLEPLRDGNPAFVLEFKVHDPEEEETLADTVAAALRQIEEKAYDTELTARGIPRERIRHYGFAFAGRTVLIG